MTVHPNRSSGSSGPTLRGPFPRVVHVVPATFTESGVIGGAERYALELARHMADVVPTRLVSFGPADDETTVGRLAVRVIGRPWHVRGQASNPFKPAVIPELLDADVIHCHQRHVLVSSIAAAAARLAGRRVFVSDLGGGGWDISAYVSTRRWYHGHLHISQYSRAISGQADDPRAHVIMGGVDTAKFSPDEAVPRDGRVVYVGRVLPHKGVDDLVDAAGDDLPLRVIGRPYDAGFMADLRKLAEGKPVEFIRDADDAFIIDAYRAALCVVLPSVYRTRYGVESKVPELLGQTLIEGMACGTPAVCTNVASMPEVVEDGVTGLVVPPNDPAALGRALRWLRDNPARAAEMGRAARRRVLEMFSWPSVVDRCLKIYASA